jgi:hypothetical protein
MMLVRLSNVETKELAQLMEEAWRNSAPKRLVDGYNAKRS